MKRNINPYRLFDLYGSLRMRREVQEVLAAQPDNQLIDQQPNSHL